MNTIKHLALSGYVTTLTAIGYVQSALADSPFGDPEIEGLPGQADEDSIRDTIIAVIEFILSFLALVAVVVIIIAGIRLILSQGEDDAKDKAKKTIFYALIGLVIVLLAQVIVGLVTNVLSEEIGS